MRRQPNARLSRRPAPPAAPTAPADTPLHRRYPRPLLIASGLIAAIALSTGVWMQNNAQAQEAGAQPAPDMQATTETATAPAAEAATASGPAPSTPAPAGTVSNIPPAQGQTGPQAMVTAAPHAPPLAGDGPLSADPLVRGAYLARMGDCVACHTAPGGQPFAGGLAMASPLGTIYSSNITPDKDTGIGGYSFEDFDRAVRHGVGKGKGNLYPAMPYPSYARISAQDMQDLYAYFMQKVEPVAVQTPANGITWPLSMRWPLGIWRTLFAPDPAKVQVTNTGSGAAPQADPALRGAYLVEGLGHCGACHTPRSFTMAEKALDQSDPLFLSGSGAPMDGWVAKNLRGDGPDGLGRWSAQDIVDLLRTGRNNHSAVFGGMADVVEHSTQYLNPADLEAIAAYLKGLKPANASASASAGYAPSNATADALWNGDVRAPGAALYVDNCAACHRSDGKGYAQVFPALSGNSAVLSADPHNVIAVILQGHRVPATAARPSTFTMPSLGWRLTDQQVADVASFVRSGWGNQAPGVTAAQVQTVRGSLPATAQEAAPHSAAAAAPAPH